MKAEKKKDANLFVPMLFAFAKCRFSLDEAQISSPLLFNVVISVHSFYCDKQRTTDDSSYLRSSIA